MTPFLHDVLVFATKAHTDVRQVRKYTGEPYIVHPIEVMMITSLAGSVTEDMLAAALLHDVVEDTEKTLDDIYKLFGISITAFVEELTEPETKGKRATRKAAEAERLSKVSDEAQTIKIADSISNIRTIKKYDPEFAKVYLPEKAALLKVLTRGDRALLSMAWDLIPDDIVPSKE